MEVGFEESEATRCVDPTPQASAGHDDQPSDAMELDLVDDCSSEPAERDFFTRMPPEVHNTAHCALIASNLHNLCKIEI